MQLIAPSSLANTMLNEFSVHKCVSLLRQFAPVFCQSSKQCCAICLAKHRDSAELKRRTASLAEVPCAPVAASFPLTTLVL